MSKINKIILPVNITHNCDMDGEGCALLTKFFFNEKNTLDDWCNPRYTYFQRFEDFVIDEDGDINMYPHATEEEIDNFLDNDIEPYDLYGLRFAKPIVYGISNTPNNLVNGLYDKIHESVYDLIHQISRGRKKIISIDDYLVLADEELEDYVVISVLFIVSDIYISDDDINEVMYRIDKAFYDDNAMIDIQGIWHIDHHMTSPISEKNEISSDGAWILRLPCDDGPCSLTFIPKVVNICYEYYRPEFYYDNLYPLLDEYGFRKNPYLIEFCDKLGLTTDRDFKRSATFHYFMFMLKMGWIGLMDTPKYAGNDFNSLAWTVYMISNYDTFEFDIKELPVPISVPDSLTILYNFYGTFGKMCDDILNFIEDSGYVYNIDHEGYERYADIPLGEEHRQILDILIERRESTFRRDSYMIKSITIPELSIALAIDFGDEAIFFDQPDKEYKIALAAGAIDDASYTGNKLCKEYGCDLVIMMYNEKRVISMRTNNKDEHAVNCGLLAKYLGGGGHKHASGCSLPEDKYKWLLDLYWKSKNYIIERECK